MDLKYITRDKIDCDKWDRCIDTAVNGNICAFSWFMDILCSEWAGIVADDYVYIMPLPVASRFGITYMLQPQFIQQLGVFGAQIPDSKTINHFLAAIPKGIKIIDYHFNEQNGLPSGWGVEMRTNFLLKLDRSYEEIRLGYTLNLVRNLKKQGNSDFYIIRNNDPQPLMKLFREVNGKKFSLLRVESWQRFSRVIHACLNRDKAIVWSVYNRDHILLGGVVWLFSHGGAVLYFSAQSKAGRDVGALAGLIDVFIRENASSEMTLDFEGSVDPGLARFYGSFGSLPQSYPRFTLNRLSPIFKMVYGLYRKVKKVKFYL